MHSQARAAGTEGVASGPALRVYDFANSETLAQAFALTVLLPDAEALTDTLAVPLAEIVG